MLLLQQQFSITITVVVVVKNTKTVFLYFVILDMF